MCAKALLIVEFHHEKKKFEAQPIHILDGLACIGGNTYSFIKIFDDPKRHFILANEWDKERFAALRHNIKLFFKYGYLSNPNVKFLNQDFLGVHSVARKADVIFLDPPWIPKSQQEKDEVLSTKSFPIGSMELDEVVYKIFKDWFPSVRILILKLPVTHDEALIFGNLKRALQKAQKKTDMFQVDFHNQKIIFMSKLKNVSVLEIIKNIVRSKESRASFNIRNFRDLTNQFGFRPTENQPHQHDKRDSLNRSYKS